MRSAHCSAAPKTDSADDLPPGVGQYQDFETIDWLKDISGNRDRHRDIHKAKRNSRCAWVWAQLDAVSAWVVVLIVGIMAGTVAGIVDIGTTWMSDLKEGVCA